MTDRHNKSKNQFDDSLKIWFPNVFTLDLFSRKIEHQLLYPLKLYHDEHPAQNMVHDVLYTTLHRYSIHIGIIQMLHMFLAFFRSFPNPDTQRKKLGYKRKKLIAFWL